MDDSCRRGPDSLCSVAAATAASYLFWLRLKEFRTFSWALAKGLIFSDHYFYVRRSTSPNFGELHKNCDDGLCAWYYCLWPIPISKQLRPCLELPMDSFCHSSRSALLCGHLRPGISELFFECLGLSASLHSFLVAEFTSPPKVFTFSFIVGNIIPKSVKCFHSATELCCKPQIAKVCGWGDAEARG